MSFAIRAIFSGSRRQPLCRAARFAVTAFAVLALLSAEISLALAMDSPATPAEHAMPCHATTGIAGHATAPAAPDGAPQKQKDKAACPMMAGAMCLSLVAVPGAPLIALPAAPAASVGQPSYDVTVLPHDFPPPDRPPKQS